MIVVNNNSGIGNRLKNIVTALRRAERKGDGLLINFPHQDFFTVDYQPNPERVKQEIEVCTTWSLELFEEEVKKKPLKKSNPIKIYHDFETTFEFNNSIDFQFNNIESWIRKEIEGYFGRIKFSSMLQDVADSYSEKFNLKDLVGVHIRSWADDKGRNLRLHNLDMFIDLMNLYPGARFFVATDSPGILSRLLQVFPNRIIASIKHEERHSSINPSSVIIFSALLDLILLSRCRGLIGTYSSTFSEVAWWLSENKEFVDIPVPPCCKF